MSKTIEQLRQFEREKLSLFSKFCEELIGFLVENAQVKEVRGKGLMIGIEMNSPCTEIVDSCLREKLLINVTAERVIRLLPPLIFDKSNADTMIETLIDCIEEFTKN